MLSARIPPMVAVAAHLLALGCRGPGPLGFEKHDVTFVSGDLRLAGTMYRPGTATPTPGVVLVHGSGETDRSSLEDMSEFFASHGVAALAYDKRGVGKSEGDSLAWRDFNFDSLAADAAAAVAFIAAQRGIDTTRIGLFAVSQGGWVAPLAALRSGDVDFLILQSASVTTVAEDNVFERSARLRSEGFTEREIDEARAMHLVDLEVSRSGARFDEYRRLWEENKGKRWFKRVYLGEAPAPPGHRYHRWYRTIMDFDPLAVLGQLDIPALWLFGDPELDRLSPVSRSVQVLDSLRVGGKDYEMHVFRGADHSLQARGEEAPYRAAILAWMKRELAFSSEP